MTVTIEPLFGGTEFITTAQRDTLELAAPHLHPLCDTVYSEDEREDGVLVAIVNSETSWGQPLAYKLEIRPDGHVTSYEWDSIADSEEWDWEEATPAMEQKLIDSGIKWAVPAREEGS